MMALSSRMRSRSRKAQEARKRKQFVRIKRRTGGEAMAEQNYANHGRNVPLFHFFALPMLIINFFWSIYRWKVFGFPQCADNGAHSAGSPDSSRRAVAI